MKKILLLNILPIMALCLVRATLPSGFIDSLKNRLAAYQSEKPYTNLYVHLDKNNYLTNESIWFKAYILTDPGFESKVLYVRLVDKTKKVVLSYQFPLHDVRANGDVLLPDTLQEGEYCFYAYTNPMINFNPNQVFVQKIKVFKNEAETMQAEAGVTDSTQLHRGGNIDILIKLKKGNNYITDAKGSYKLFVDDKPFRTGKISTNFLGEAFVSFTYPQMSDDKTLKVKATFNKGDDKAELNLNLRHEASPIDIRTYTEGGHLIEGINNHVVIEAGDSHNNPLATDIFFTADGKRIAELKTNRYGMANFNFIPKKGVLYAFNTAESYNEKQVSMSTPIESSGLGLNITGNNGEYYATVINKTKSDSITLILRGYEGFIWGDQIYTKPGDSVKIALPVANITKQVLSLALFDTQGNCAAERLFMPKKSEDYHIIVHTDSAVYRQRHRVKVTISATDIKNMPVGANISVSVVEKSRINFNSYNTILDSYHARALNASFPDQHYHFANDADMDAILITKKWYANSWSDILNYHAVGKFRMIINTDGVFGIITRLSHKPVDLKQLFIYSKRGLIEVPIKTDGTFYVPSENLIAERNDKRYLMLNSDFYDKYAIKLENYDSQYDDIVKYADAFNFLEPYNAFVSLNDKTGINLKGNIQLKEVKIKSRSITTEPDLPGAFKSKTCNDYVCINNILNCPNHKFGIPPVNGGVYKYGGQRVVYHGCGSEDAETHFLLKNVSLPNNFILPDYDKDPSNEPELRSTVYWSPNLNTDAGGKASFEFFTSDIKGEFTIMAQGINITNLKPVYGTGSFMVK